MYLMYLYVNVCKCILRKTGVAALITALVTLVGKKKWKNMEI